jgi:glutamate/aspartate transport system permease protein
MNYNWNWGIFWEPLSAGSGYYWQLLLKGLGWTVATALSAWLIALVIGIYIGTARTLPSRWLSWPAYVFTELFRNIPLLVQMFFWFFVLPELLPVEAGRWLKRELPYPSFITAVVALALYTAARTAEQVRAGIGALPKGQRQAAYAIGMSTMQVYRFVLLPQALRIMIPPLTSDFMGVFKNSSVALVIGLIELTAAAQQMNEYTFQGFETFAAATLLYVVVALAVNRGMAWLERRTAVPGMIGSEAK